MAEIDLTSDTAMMVSANGLIREARSRQATLEFLRVPKGTEIPIGWKIQREYKTKILLVREKDVETQLRDKVWLLFYKMGIPRITSSDFTLEIKGAIGIEQIQPAVVAQDEEIIFLVMTYAQELPARKKRMQQIIDGLDQKQPSIKTALKKALGVPQAKVVSIISTENIEWSDSDRKFAHDKGFLVWDEYDILALEELAAIAGEGARYQVYNRIFYGKKIKSFEIHVPALKAKMAGRSYYCMTMTPEHLLKIAYVHQRSVSSTFTDISETYQRVLDSKRVQEIRRYVEEGGFFPNSVILNFTRPFRKEERIGSQRQIGSAVSVEPMMVTLPPYFGSAWIIDGQHRIYGYANSTLKGSETIPVVAFVGESPETQARIFLDINEKQKAIKSDLRWDLYEDIYLEATNPHEQELYAISVIAKRLNKLSPFSGSIKIPAEGNKGHISLTTLCRVIKSERFIAAERDTLRGGGIIESIDFATQRIATFFQVIADLMPVEWRSGEGHYIHTNAGIVVFLGILKDILNSMDPSEIRNIEQFKSIVTKYLEPVFRHLREAQPQTIKRYRAVGGATGASRQIQALLVRLIISANIGFESHFLVEYEKEQSERERTRRIGIEEDRLVVLLAGETEALEIKGSLLLDIDRLLLGDGKKEKSDKVVEDVLGTIVGFLNGKRERGQLVIGVIEIKRYGQDKIEQVLGTSPKFGSYIVVGIENDYNYRDWDNYELQIRDLIKDHISPDVEASLNIESVPVVDRSIGLITVERDPNRWFYFDNQKFYVRIGNRTRLLTGREMDDYKAAWHGKVERT